MQLAELSPLDFRLTGLSSVLDISEQVSLGAVSGGPYISTGQFGNYSFKGLVDEGGTGFLNLPYDNPNLQVRIWILDLLEKNGLISDSSSSPTLEVFVQKLKMEAQRSRLFSRNYRACLVELKLIVLDKQGQTVREGIVEGIAKLYGSDQTVVGRQFLSVDVVFSPDEPPVCKLAIANALRGKQKGGEKTMQSSIR
jgi:hypothetical protein